MSTIIRVEDLKVKTFEASSASQLDEEVNRWLKGKRGDIGLLFAPTSAMAIAAENGMINSSHSITFYYRELYGHER